MQGGAQGSMYMGAAGRWRTEMPSRLTFRGGQCPEPIEGAMDGPQYGATLKRTKLSSAVTQSSDATATGDWMFEMLD